MDASKPLAGLTAEEAKSACHALSNSVSQALPDEDLTRYACTLFGAIFSVQSKPDGTLAIDKAACMSMVDDCIADAQGEATTQDNCETGTVSTDLMSCTATVGELEACLDAAIAGIRSQLDMVSCDSPVSTTPPATQEISQLPACAQVEAKCPGLAEQLTPEMDSSVSVNGGGPDAEPIGPGGCTDTCAEAADAFCDDGGEDAEFSGCEYGTDCTDCGERPAN